MKPVFLLLAAALVILAWLLQRPGDIARPPGVLAADEPWQATSVERAPITIDDYRLAPLADFYVEARVLARRNYHFDRESDLAPLDLGLGWGRMSDSAVLQALTFSQHDRFMYWKTKAFPIPRREIETSAANMHIIPADAVVAAQLEDVRVGHVVRLEGKLVAVQAGDGWRWRSSLSRGDTGAGACELFYVQAVTFE